MKKFIIQSVLLLAVAGIALFLFKTGTVLNLPFLPENPVAKEIVINNTRIKVELADTSSKRKQGLGGRQTLASDEGMLFIFEDSGKHPFWMKGLSFALDFVWINGNKVADVTENVQPPVSGQNDEFLPIYQSKEDIDKVLEVSAGTAQRLNIKVGDTLKIE